MSPPKASSSLATLITRARACSLCAHELPLGPRPVFQLGPKASILIAGQAPGAKVHDSGVPFDDPSGDRLRDWMDIDRDTFYNPNRIAILPMGFCYPGKGKSVDLPPRKECALEWRQPLLDQLRQLKLTLVIGQYALKWHIPEAPKELTATVKAWRSYEPSIIPLPHPSPRNNIWLSKNRWFVEELLPNLKKRVKAALR